MSPRSPPSTTRRGLLGLCGAGAVGLAGCGTIGRDCPGPSSAGAPTDWPHRYHDLGQRSNKGVQLLSRLLNRRR